MNFKDIANYLRILNNRIFMIFREAIETDIDQMHALRLSVRENVLITHSLVTHDHYIKYLFTDGKGWVCETDDRIAGFGIVNLKGKNIWGLFVAPEFENRGIGSELQKIMLNWYFDQSKETISLSTAQHTRAEKFYTATGWKRCGILSNGEVQFEMSFDRWSLNRFLKS